MFRRKSVNCPTTEIQQHIAESTGYGVVNTKQSQTARNTQQVKAASMEKETESIFQDEDPLKMFGFKKI